MDIKTAGGSASVIIHLVVQGVSDCPEAAIIAVLAAIFANPRSHLV